MLKQYYHICNPSTPELSGYKNIVSIKQLKELKDETNNIYLLNIHLNWNESKLSSNYGFDIANLLRTEIKSKTPIIFYSPIPVEYFEKKSEKEIKYKILFGRGSAFIEAPFKEAVLNKVAYKIEPLTRAALHDVVTMLCNLKGIVIDKLNHDLKFDVDIDKVINSISPYLSALQKSEIRLESFVINLKESVIQNKSTLFNDYKQSFILLCNRKLTEQGNKEQQRIRTKHKILLIDDLLSEIDKAENFLKDDFIVQTATKGEEAINILKNDIENKIVAVISDWRLFTDENQNYWQPLQGYEVLDFAAKNGIRSLFALTSQADFVVHQLRNLMGIRFSMFKKENLNTHEQWKVFADVLFEACVATDELLNSQPTSDQWYNRIRKKKDLGISLKDVYAFKRHMQSTFFSEIDYRADEIWNIYLENNKHLRYQLGTLSTSHIDEGVLKEVLVQRRIWIALFQSSITPEKIYEFMSKTPNKTPSQSDITQLKIKLCIVENDIKHRRFLPEEKAWLKKWNLIE